MIKKNIERIDGKMLNGSDLAYVGDAYYELFIRTYLLSLGVTKPQELHKKCTKYVSAASHAVIVKEITNVLTEEELNVFHRGRNYNYRHRSKSAKLGDYLLSSGFEALVGYLFLTDKQTRLDEILTLAVEIVERQ